jgi:hypothetical protein
MTDRTQYAPPKTAWQKASRWVLAISGFIIMIAGLIKLATVFFPGLPACNSDTATGVVRNIFKQKNVQITTLADIKPVNDGFWEKTCEARIETPIELGSMQYRIYWQDRDVMVMITAVNVKPR